MGRTTIWITRAAMALSFPVALGCTNPGERTGPATTREAVSTAPSTPPPPMVRPPGSAERPGPASSTPEVVLPDPLPTSPEQTGVYDQPEEKGPAEPQTAPGPVDPALVARQSAFQSAWAAVEASRPWPSDEDREDARAQLKREMIDE